MRFKRIGSVSLVLQKLQPLSLSSSLFLPHLSSTQYSTMAFKQTLVQRLFNMPKISNPSLTNCRISSSPTSIQTLIPSNPAKTMAPDPGENGIFRRFLHKSAILPPTMTPEFRSIPVGEKLMEKLRGMDIVRDRIRLDGLTPPGTRSDTMVGLSVEDARKLLKLSQLEMVKSKLRQIPKNWISHSEFVQICVEGCSDPDQGLGFAKMLDQSGTVIVLGNVVFLRPEQVVKTIEGLIPAPVAHPNDPRRKELEEMEKQKAAIDKKAESLVRHELWCGLGFLVVQTAGFMRLTFWELSWDVMEPICFYVTSTYFMAGYAFFLRTSKEPSFEGFFQSRFSAKQKRLMKNKNFDIGRYNELWKACSPHSSGFEQAPSPTPLFDNSERAQLGALRH